MAAFVLGATLLVFGLSLLSGPTSPAGRLATATSVLGSALALVAVWRGRVGVAASLVVGSVWMAGMVIIAARGARAAVVGL